MCRAHATVRGLLQKMLLGADDTCWVVVDLEAGVEVMSRATPRAVDVLFVVVEPYHCNSFTADWLIRLHVKATLNFFLVS